MTLAFTAASYNKFFLRIDKKITKVRLPVCYPIKTACVFIILSLFFFSLQAQVQTRAYDISYKGDNVGSMQFYQKKTGENIYMKMISAVQMRFIIKIKVNTQEESVFQDGKLVYSTFARQVNGKEKANTHTKATGTNSYQTFSEGESSSINNKSIDYNFNLLYSNEPHDAQMVYSDSFQKFLHIKKVAEHKYKIELPDGNYNYYTFKNGICSNVEVHQRLYTIQITMKG